MSTSTSQENNLPVIIVGAGPCGLVTALALKKYKVPFVIIEKASRSKICSNAGSGFELATTSITILNRLGINVPEILSEYKGLSVLGPDGKMIRSSALSGKSGAVNRAQMQNYLLDILFPTSEDEEGVLLCGSGLETYKEEVDGGGRVVAILSSGQHQAITGCLLLACDGIHSRVRAVMHGGYDSTKDWESNAKKGAELDPLHFCNTIVYWGKTSVEKGTKLEREFTKTQGKDGKLASFAFSLTSHKVPANIFMIPSENATVCNWVVTIASNNKEQCNKSKNNNGYLTRRRGSPLTEEEKEKLFDFSSDEKDDPNNNDDESVVRGMTECALLQELVKHTPAKDITKAGLYDREKLDLPFSSESNLVALLGDAAHPQTPILGQGVNMAIADAYVYATNIALSKNKNKKKSPREAISRSTTAERNKSSKATVEQARAMMTLFTSQNPFVCWMLYVMLLWIPTKYIASTTEDGDKSNSDFLKYLDEECCHPEEQNVLLRA